jgi:hypothetical protein
MMQQGEALNEVREQVLLPAGVRVLSDKRIIHFDADGAVEQPAHTLLVLNRAEDKGHQLVVE